MRLLLFGTAFLFTTATIKAQSLGGFTIADKLITAVHTIGCNPAYVTGSPDDSTWVNFKPNDVITGNFSRAWVDGIGDDLLIETSFHEDNYRIRLILSNGSLSAQHAVTLTDWTLIGKKPWKFIGDNGFGACVELSVTGQDDFILPLDFNKDFGLTCTDTVVGIEVTFLSTAGEPDLAGVYIIENAPLDVELGNDTVLCDGSTILLNAAIPGATYRWQDSATDSIYTVSKPGTYWVEVTIDGCILRDTIMVGFKPRPVADLGIDTSICLDSSLLLSSPNSSAVYLWQDGSTTESILVKQDGIYWVEVSTNCGLARDSISIETRDCECYLYVPNVFTPDHDGINEGFIPKSNCRFENYHFIIYNRWGEAVFETLDPTEHWEPKNEIGLRLTDDVYVYYLKYTFLNETKRHRVIGSVTLVR